MIIDASGLARRSKACCVGPNKQTTNNHHLPVLGRIGCARQRIPAQTAEFRHMIRPISCRHGLQPPQATGVLEAAGAAAAGTAAAAVGESLLRHWMGLPADAELPMQQETGPVRETSCELTICSTTITCGERKHVLLAFVLTDAANHSSSSSSRSSQLRNTGFGLADLRSPVIHWGCVAGKGDRWQAPPAGWSTWPDVSYDARGGAWQTPLAEQQLPNGGGLALTMLLQLPCEGPIRHGGLAFLVKAGNSWLGNAATFSDFFNSTAGLPGLSAEALAAVASKDVVADGDAALLLRPDQSLDLKRLASTPVSTWEPDNNNNNRKQKSRGKQEWRQQQEHHHHHNNNHAQEPELPNAGRRAKEPAADETQVCKLTAAELQAAAASQLASWLQQQDDLEVPAGGLQVMQHEFAVRGHPSTPFVMASTAVWQKPDPCLPAGPDSQAGSGGPERQAVLLLAAMGDVGLTGTRRPGLVLHWSGVEAADAAGAAARLEEVASGAAPVAALPEGWATLPDLSWDAGSGFWETPMTRDLLVPDAGTAGAAGVLERPASPRPAGASEGAAADMYLVLLRLPLQGVFRAGGLLFNMRTSRRQWVRNAETGGTFFLNTSSHAQQLGLLPPPPTAQPAAAPPPPPPGSTAGAADQQPQQQLVLDEASHKALAAAGLSEDEILAFAASMPPPRRAASHAGSSPPGSSSSSSQVKQSLKTADSPALDALSSADADMAAHIEANSANSANSGTGGLGGHPALPLGGAGGGGGSGGGPLEAAAAAAAPGAGDGGQVFGPGGVARFLRDFEARPVSASELLWGEVPEGQSFSDYQEVPEMPPHQDLVSRISQLEHKAQRSLMHRFGIAADLVSELLPDLRAAAAEAPGSLTWPPAPLPSNGGFQQQQQQQGDLSHSQAAAARGRQALSALVAVAVWLRLSALRLLTWNHNYNVKPREISAALDRLGANLLQVYEAAPQLSGVVLLALSSAGRGGEGDMGQRIRDEILAIQHRNGCKGGMMEEWHQKLHNNSSPDDLAICQALLDYLAGGQQQQAYWDSLAAAGITAARLASFDRPIRSPPPVFKPEQVQQLTQDLLAYRRTLAAVHSGADLSAAIDGVLGYDAGECKGKRVKVEPLAGVATPQLRQLLAALLAVVQAGGSGSSSSGGPGGGSRPASPGGGGSSSSSNNMIAAMMEMERCLKLQGLVVAARHCLAPALRSGDKACHGRLRDILFLDLALELTGRGALEGGLSAVRAAAPSTLLGGLLALLLPPLASACMSALPGQGGNVAMVAVYRQLQQLSSDCPGLDAAAKARQALSLLERLRSLLAASSASATALLQPTAEAMAVSLGLVHDNQGSTRSGSGSGVVDAAGPVSMLAEEVVRGSAAAALSLLLNAVEPSLRRLAGVGAWTIVSRLPTSTSGTLSSLKPGLSQVDPSLLAASTSTSTSSPSSILLLQRLEGDEEVPPGVAAVVIVGDCPDVLSHAAVRARNCRIPVVAVPSSEEALVSQVVALAGRYVNLVINGDDVTLHESSAAATATAAAPTGPKELPAQEQGQQKLAAASAWSPDASSSNWVITPDQFAAGIVGAKALSSAQLGLAAGAAAATGPGLQQQPEQQQQLLLLPSWLKVPSSVALPHGCFEAVLRAPENAAGGVGEQLQQLAAKVAAEASNGAANHHAAAAAAIEQDLQQLRSLVQQLKAPAALQQQLCQQLDALAAAAAEQPGSSGKPDGASSLYSWGDVWSAVKGVWSSQWNDRALAALSKAQLPLQQLRMGVLLQPLLPARYSWVAHTVNPATGSSSEVVVQVVVGLGEVLVGNHPGRALGGVIKRDSLTAALQLSLQQQQQQQQEKAPGSGSPGNEAAAAAEVWVPSGEELLKAVDIVSFASKDAAVLSPGLQLPCEIGSSISNSAAAAAVSVGGGAAAAAAANAVGGGGGGGGVAFMARSDSNAEDLPGFAGAGLFDSLPSVPTRTVLLDYTAEPLMWDRTAAAALLWRCALAAVTAEHLLLAAEQQQEQQQQQLPADYQGLDVEGCVTTDGCMWLLQGRPQV